MPSPEAPARLASVLGSMYAGLAAVGVDERGRWAILHKLAFDAVPAMRRAVLGALVDAEEPALRSSVMATTGIPRAPIERTFEDLALLGLVESVKSGDRDNDPWRHRISDAARQSWPTTCPETSGTGPAEAAPKRRGTGVVTSHSHSQEDISGQPAEDADAASLELITSVFGDVEVMDAAPW